jgi:hypothetical protein
LRSALASRHDRPPFKAQMAAATSGYGGASLLHPRSE